MGTQLEYGSRVGKRAAHLRERDDAETLLARPLVAGAASERSSGLQSHVLSLQRTFGNTAVRTLLIQRRERPQSTDAPRSKKTKKTIEPDDYAPKEGNPKFASWETSALAERGASEADSTVKNSWYFAAELYEEYWFRTKQRAAGEYLARVYKKLADAKRESFWRGVALGTIKPGQKKSADDDMTGKEF